MLRKESKQNTKIYKQKILNSFNWTFKVLIERLFCQFAYNLEL